MPVGIHSVKSVKAVIYSVFVGLVHQGYLPEENTLIKVWINSCITVKSSVNRVLNPLAVGDVWLDSAQVAMPLLSLSRVVASPSGVSVSAKYKVPL